MALGSWLWIAGIVAETVVVALLLAKRVFRMFPIFCACVTWGLVSDIGYYAAAHLSPSPAAYFWTYTSGLLVESILEFGVLVELVWSILRPMRSALPRGAIVAVALVIGGLCAAVWPFAESATYGQYGPHSRFLIHLLQTFSVMRVLFFLVLAACSQLLSISWRDRELQIATGLGFYSLVSIAVSIIQAGQAVGPMYNLLNQAVAAAYLCSLIYWAFSFATKEAPRREFTPQMQGFLLAVAGAARSTRVSLTEGHAQKGRKADD